jgi:hypothetical protein
MLWRIFGVASTAAGPCTIAFSIIYDWTHLSWLEATCRYLLVGVGFAYVVSRLGLIVLILYSFSAMPAAIYETVDWTGYLPHLG